MESGPQPVPWHPFWARPRSGTRRVIRYCERPEVIHTLEIDVTAVLARSNNNGVDLDCVDKLGGALEVVIPASNYFTGISDPVSRERCEAYLDAAASTVTMPYETSGPPACLSASQYLIDRCELLLAVWDGSPATGGGGTADAVAYARERGRSIMVVWPEGAQRS